MGKLDNPVRSHEVRTALAGGVILALILIGAVAGYAFPLLRAGPPVSYETVLGLLVVGTLTVGLFTWWSLSQEEDRLPERIRILPDRVIAYYGQKHSIRQTGGSLSFPFSDSTLIFDRGVFWRQPRVFNFLRPTYPGEVRALVLTATNVSEVKRAFDAWKAAPHGSNLSVVEPPLKVSLPLGTEERGAGIRWIQNSAASTGRHTQRLRQAAAVAGILVGAFFVLETVFLVPYVGLLWALYWTVAWFPYDLVLVVPWLIVLLPFYPWWVKDIPQIGLDVDGLHLRHRNKKERVIPWAKVGGPTHQSFGESWILFFQLQDGTFSAKDYTLVDEKVARAIGQDPRCLRQKMVKADAKALGLGGDSTSPLSTG